MVQCAFETYGTVAYSNHLSFQSVNFSRLGSGEFQICEVSSGSQSQFKALLGSKKVGHGLNSLSHERRRSAKTSHAAGRIGTNFESLISW